MAATVSELLVKIRPDGVKETTNALEDQSQAFEDTADAAQEQTGKLESFSKRWRGAGLVFGATFGVLTAAIASKMPIIDEVASSMDLVLTSLANKIDEDVRPEVSGLSDDLADLSQDIDDADNSAEAFGITIRGLTDIGIDIGLDFRAKETGPSKAEQAKKKIQEFAQGFFGTDEPVEIDLPTEFSIGDTTFDIDYPSLKDTVITGLQTGLSAVGLGELAWAIEIGEMFSSKFGDGALDEFDRQLPILRLRFDKFVNNLDAGIDEAVTRFRFQFKTGWDLIQNDFKRFLNGIIRDFNDKVNDIIDASNRYLGTNFGNFSGMGTFNVSSRSAIVGRNRRAMNRELGGIDRRRRSENRQIDRLIAEMQNQTHETTVNVDGREVATATTPYVGRGAVLAGATGVRR